MVGVGASLPLRTMRDPVTTMSVAGAASCGSPRDAGLRLARAFLGRD